MCSQRGMFAGDAWPITPFVPKLYEQHKLGWLQESKNVSNRTSVFRRQASQPLCRYNRKVIRPTLIAAAVSLVLLASCKKDLQNQDAVRQGVMSYLSKRSDLLAMDVSVSSVAFQQDEATAQVHFQAKGNSSPAAGMTMQYVLERKDGQWVVKGRTGSNAAHGAGATGVNMPPGQETSPGSLDGMPRISTPSGAESNGLPPGHPSVSDSTSQQK
jgi:hypothetical protein